MTHPGKESALEPTHEWVMDAYYEYTRRLSAYENDQRNRSADFRKMFDDRRAKSTALESK